MRLRLRLLENFVTVIDIAITLLIVIVTVYITWKKKKNNEYIDDKACIDEQKWFVIKSEVQKNIKKYQDIKSLWKSLLFGLGIPFWILWMVWFLWFIWFLLYEFVTGKLDIKALCIYLIIIFICIISWIITFIKSKKILDKYKNNLIYKINKIWVIMFASSFIIIGWRFAIAFIDELKIDGGLVAIITLLTIIYSIIWCLYFFIRIKNFLECNIAYEFLRTNILILISITIIFLWWFGVSFVCEKLGLNTRLSAFIELLLGFSSTIYWFYFLFSEIKKSFKNNLHNNTMGNNIEKCKSTENELIEKDFTYDKLMDADKRLKEKTWFHQWSLLK